MAYPKCVVCGRHGQRAGGRLCILHFEEARGETGDEWLARMRAEPLNLPSWWLAGHSIPPEADAEASVAPRPNLDGTRRERALVIAQKTATRLTGLALPKRDEPAE